MYNLKLSDLYFLPHIGCHIELSLKGAEVLTLVGENGLGKTSLVQRFYSDHFGTSSIIEQRPSDLFYDRSLKNLKKIFLNSAGKKINIAMFNQCWASFGLNQKEDRMLSSLSGGEGQALKLCLGLSPEAKLYILDEPSQYLDEKMKQVLSTLIAELLLQQKSILMVEHDLSWQKFNMKVAQLKIVNQTLMKGDEWNT